MKKDVLPTASRIFLVSFLALATTAPLARAANYIRANTATALNTAGAWTNAGVPVINDILIWDSTVTTPAFCTNGPTAAVVTWGGIRISNAPAAVNITGSPTNLIIFNTNTSGTFAGIEVAGADLIIGGGSIVQVNVAQTWAVGAGRSLSLETGNLLTIRRDLTLSGFIQHGRGIDVVSNATLNIGPGTVLIATNGTGSLFRIAQGSGLSGTVNQTGGTNIVERAGTAAVINLGNAQNATGTYNLSGGLLDTSRSNNALIAIANQNTGTGCIGVLNISGTGRLNAAVVNVGASTAPDSSGKVTISSTGVFNAISVVMAQATFTAPATSNSFILVKDSGTFTSGSLTVGSRGPSTFTITNSAVAVITNTFQLAGASAPIEGSGTANLDGGTLTIPSITRGGGSNNTSVFNFNGGQLVISTNSLNFAATNTGANNGGITLNVMTGGAKIDTAGWGITNFQPLLHGSGVNPDGGFIKTGLGSVALLGTNTYSGATLLNAGEVTLSTAHAGGGTIQTADGTTFGVRVNRTNASLPTASLTLGSSAGADLVIDVGATGNPTAPVITATNLTVNGTVNLSIRASGAGLSIGTFTLIDFVTGGGSFNLVSLPPGVTATVQTNGTQIDLNVTDVPVNLTWNGDFDGEWVGPANWRDNTFTSVAFSPGSILTFDDSATGTTAIDLSSAVAPGGVFMTFANDSLSYSISGSGSIGGTVALNKTGAGTLTMGVSNNYPGDTILSAGTFTLGANNVIPDGAGRGNLFLEGTLDLNGFSEAVNGFTGTNATGVVANTGGSPATFTIGSNGVAGSFNGVISGTALKLQKVGGQTNKLLGINTHTGGNTFLGGTVEINNGNALGAVTGPLTIGGSTLRTFGNITNTAPTFTLNGNATFTITNNSTVSISGNIFTTNIANNLAVNGAGTLLLSGSGEFGGLRADNGKIVVTGGSLTNNNTVALGRIANTRGVGTLVLDGATLRVNDVAADIAAAEVAGCTGTLHITNGARLEFMNFYVAKVANTTGAVYQSSGVVTNIALGTDPFSIAGNNDDAHITSIGNYFLSGGRLDVITNMNIGSDGTGVFNMTGGEANGWVNAVSVGRFAPAAVGTLQVSGGTFNQRDSNANLIIGQNAVGTLLVSGSGVVNVAGSLQLGSAATGDGTVSLQSGGRIVAPQVIDGSGTSTFYFRGGTLQATMNTTNYIRLLTNAFVGSAGANIDTGTNSITIAQALLEDPNDSGGGLVKTGSGTLTLSAANSYPGTTLVNSGKLFITPSYSGNGEVTVVDDAGFGGRRDASGATANVGTLNMGSAGSTTFDFDLGVFGNPTSPVVTVFFLNNVGTTISANVSGGNLSNGTFTLVSYGSIANTYNFALGTLPRGVAATLQDNPPNVDLAITAVNPLTWRGTNGNNWNINTTTNWVLNGTNTTYLELDNVLFDDTGSASTTVNLATNVSPSKVTVSNSISYTFVGTNRITGPGGLTKLGSGILTLATSNDYNSVTLISAGTLRLGTNEALPNGTGRGNVIVNATLDLNGFTDTIMGLDGTGVVNNSSASNANLIIGANNSSGSFSGVIQDTGGDLLLTKNGTGTNLLASASTWSGGTLINNGRLSFAHDNALGSGPVTFDAGGTLANIGSRTLANPLRSTTTTGAANLNTDGGDLLITGNVSFDGPEFTKLGSNTLRFAASAVVGLGTNSGFDVSGGSVIIDGASITHTNDGFRLRATTNFPTVDVTVQNNATLIVGGGGVLNIGATADTNFSVVSFTNILNITSGTVMTGTGSIAAGNTVGNAGIVNQNGGAVGATNPANINGLILATTTNSSGVYNLNAGSLTVSRIRKGGTNNASARFVFGGGTLKALNDSNSAAFISGVDQVLVRATGARIDSDVFDVAITDPLAEDAGSTGGGFVKLGTGSLALNGTNTFTGAVTVSNGVLRGTGIIPTAVTVTSGGRIGGGSIGTNIGTLTINANCTATGGATMRVNKAGVTLTSDKVSATGTLTLGGTLTVLIQGDNLAAGDTFDLFDAGGFSGGFTSYNLATLPPNLSWDTRDVSVNGLIKVVKTTTVETMLYDESLGTLTLTGSGGQPNAGYRVLSSTAMDVPINLWTQVATGTFDGSGNFSLPITVTPSEAKRFYVLIYP